MLCGKCRKNQATKTYEQIKKGKREISYYCLDCYHQYFLSVDETLGGETLSACPYCGTTVTEFRKRNLVGCANCYTSLQHAVFPVVAKMQGEQLHKGKCPYSTDAERAEKRRLELESMAEKYYSENDYKAAGKYEEQISRLIEGYEEVYSWHSQNSSKQS